MALSGRFGRIFPGRRDPGQAASLVKIGQHHFREAGLWHHQKFGGSENGVAVRSDIFRPWQLAPVPSGRNASRW